MELSGILGLVALAFLTVHFGLNFYFGHEVGQIMQSDWLGFPVVVSPPGVGKDAVWIGVLCRYISIALLLYGVFFA